MALAELCEQYYKPVEAFIRQRKGVSEAADLTQAFFAKFLQSNGVHRAERRLTRFRSYLLGAVKHFLADQRDYERAEKRGGGVSPVPMEAPSETSPVLELADSSEDLLDKRFDREWAVTVLRRSLNHLRVEAEGSGKGEQFEILKHWLPGASGLSQTQALEKLQMTEGALKVAIHRLRKRFREAVSGEIAQTVNSEEDLRDELRYLVDVLS